MLRVHRDQWLERGRFGIHRPFPTRSCCVLRCQPCKYLVTKRIHSCVCDCVSLSAPVPSTTPPAAATTNSVPALLLRLPTVKLSLASQAPIGTAHCKAIPALCIVTSLPELSISLVLLLPLPRFPSYCRDSGLLLLYRPQPYT